MSEDEDLLHDQNEAYLQSLAQAFRSVLDAYSDRWFDVPDPSAVGPVPVAGLVVYGSRADNTATLESDIDIDILVDGKVVGKQAVSSVAQSILRGVKEQLPGIDIDSLEMGVDISDLKSLIIDLLTNVDNRVRPIVIIYDKSSKIRELIETQVRKAGIQCRWISV